MPSCSARPQQMCTAVTREDVCWRGEGAASIAEGATDVFCPPLLARAGTKPAKQSFQAELSLSALPSLLFPAATWPCPDQAGRLLLILPPLIKAKLRPRSKRQPHKAGESPMVPHSCRHGMGFVPALGLLGQINQFVECKMLPEG